MNVLLREVSALDGASPWQTTRQVILPLLGPTVRVSIFLFTIGSLQLFDIPWIMTLGPAGASTTMSTYLIDKGPPRTRNKAASSPLATALAYLAGIVIVIVTIVPLPLYLLLRDLGLLENMFGVAMPEAAFSLSITIVILRPFMRAIPAELEDAAVIGGTTKLDSSGA